jgi:putative membrane protein
MRSKSNGWTTGLVCGSALLLGACGMFGERGGDSGAASTGGQAEAAGTGTAASAQQALSEQDREFAMRASQSGMAEVEASQLAVSKANSEEVRAFAQRMVRDHTATNEELMRILRGKNLSVPTQPDAEHRAQVDAMRAMDAEAFERAYMQDMGVRAHQDAVSLYERQAREGSDPDLRAFASRTLLALREHLAMAEQVAAVAERE